MSGQGARFQSRGIAVPKPLVPVLGVPMIQRVLEAFPKHWPKHFILAENHRILTELPNFLQSHWPSSHIDFVPVHKMGPAPAIIKALSQIPVDDAVLVSYCDFSVSWDAFDFERWTEEVAPDAAIMTYRGFQSHTVLNTPCAYARLEGEVVKELREKSSFTSQSELEHASTGAYYFRSAKILLEALNWQFEDNLQHSGEFFTSLTIQTIINRTPAAIVRAYEVPYFFQWGTPEDIESYEFWKRLFTSVNEQSMEQTLRAIKNSVDLSRSDVLAQAIYWCEVHLEHSTKAPAKPRDRFPEKWLKAFQSVS
jgi:NDP-sugar pyrophosphorylase family protein